MILVPRCSKWNGSWRDAAWFGEKLALTPALSPEERENRPPRFDETKASSCRAAYSAGNDKVGMTRETFELSYQAALLLPLLGERAGVRASFLLSAPTTLTIPLITVGNRNSNSNPILP